MWANRQKDIASLTDEVRVKIPVAAGRQNLVVAISGTFVGTLKIQTSDDGKVWSDGTVVKMSDGTAANPTGTGLFCALLGAAAVAGRVIFSAYTSGTARIQATPVPHQA